MDVKTKHNLDLRDTIQPLALLKYKKAFQEMRPGETLEILIDDPETQLDIFKILSDYTFDVIHQEEIKAKDPYYRIQLKKQNLPPNN